MKIKTKAFSGDWWFVVINSTLLILAFIATLYPLIYVVSASISDPKAVTSGEMLLLPIRPTLEGYKYIFQYKELWVGYGNSIFYTVVGTSLNLLFTIPCAYALSRRDMPCRNLVMGLLMITMYINGGLIPSYLNMDSFGLVNTRSALLVGGLVSVFNLIIAKTFMSTTIPYELTEAAKIDGCSDFRLLWSIILPLSKPVIAVLALYYGVNHWNSYFNAMIYVSRRRELYPLQMILRGILIDSALSTNVTDSGLRPDELAALMQQAEVMNLIKYCVIIVATLPMMLIYPRLQKYFAKGVMIGSVKG